MTSNRSQVFKAICKKTPIHEYIFLINLQAYNLKNTPTQMFSYEFWLIFQTTFLWNTLEWWLRLLNTIFLLRWSHQQNFNLNLDYALIIFNFFMTEAVIM